MEHNTLLPTGGMLSGKSKWEVGKPRIIDVSTAPQRWRVARHTIEEAGKKRHTWTVMGTHLWPYRDFPTWREAMDYADQQARQVTATLPSAKPGDHVVAGKGLYSLHVNHRAHCTDVMLGGWDGVTVENSHLEALALYLLALAKKRECA